MQRSLVAVSIAALMALGDTAHAQRACATGIDAKIWYSNARIGGNVEYSNYRQPGGIVAGDAVWKVFPSEWFLRTRRGVTVNQVRLSVQVINRGTPQTANWGTFDVRFARRDTNGWLVPDLARTPPLFRRSPPILIDVQDGYWSSDPTMGTRDLPGFGFDPAQEPGIAIILYGNPGDSPTTPPSIALPTRSAGERYVRAPQPSFSGVIDGRTGQLSLLVPPLVPEASEVQFEPGFTMSNVQPSASSASDSLDPGEDYLGIGAYYNDLASRGGRLRLYVEDDAFRHSPAPAGRYGVPLLSLGRGAGFFMLPGLDCEISIDMTNPTAWLPLQWGWLGAFQVRDPYTLSADGYMFTSWLQIPQAADLIGCRVHFEVLSIYLSGSTGLVTAPSSSLELVLR